jgi:hypothetical protein
MESESFYRGMWNWYFTYETRNYLSRRLQGQLETLARNGSFQRLNETAHQAWLGDNSFDSVDNEHFAPSLTRSARTAQDNNIMPIGLRSSDSAFLRNRYAPLREKSSTRVLSDRFEV